MDTIAVLWDLDGVLVDTQELHYRSFEESLIKFNLPFPRENYAALFGKNNAGVIASVLGKTPTPELVDKITAEKEKWFLAHLKEYASLFPGVLDWLSGLRTMSIKQAIASSAPYLTIDPLIDQFNIRNYFDKIVSGYYLPSKPDPAVYLEAARQLEVDPKHCLVIEDAIVGVEGAHAAGMKCLGVLTTNSAEDMKKADCLITRLDQMQPDAIFDLLKRDNSEIRAG
jgi:HAD superfamily hydrolase (TIGR01509 family)